MAERLQIYGRFDGYWSHAGVSRGMVQGLVAHGFDVQVRNAVPEPCTDLPGVVEAKYTDASLPGVYIGGYPHMAWEYLKDHTFKAALLIAESRVIPATWVLIANRLDLVMVPSRWVQQAFIGCGVDSDKVVVVPHGLDDVYLEPEAGARVVDATREHIRFFHVCGAASFLDRKGTPQLIEAFAALFDTGGLFAGLGKLTIRTPETPQIYKLLAGVDPGVIDIDPSPEALAPRVMLEKYLGHDVIIQPSRAEAYGIVPCEARALGLPVILTNCTGHADHFVSGVDIGVHHSGDEHIATNFIPNGIAPGVDKEAVASALATYMHKRPQYRPSRHWSWPAATLEVANYLKEKLA